MSYFGNKKAGEKIFRGAYSFWRNTNMYSEESFEVFRDKKDMTYTFVSDITSRVSTGELLNINVNFIMNKEYIPIDVLVKRSLGSQTIEERYLFDQRHTKVNYTFKTEDDIQEVIISTQPKFFIATPASCTSMLYIRSKKFDQTGNNYFSIISSQNMWEYVGEPVIKNIVVQRMSPNSENIKVGDSNLDAIQYRIQDGDNRQDDDDQTAKQDDIRIWCSQHMTIPYLIKANDGTKIEVKYLNNLDKDT